MNRPANVEEYISNNKKWQEELILLRELMLSTGMEETIKWGFPCYMIKGKNIGSLAAFKDYFGVWFFQGALLKDELGVLKNAQEGKTKAMRQWRFTSMAEIKPELVLAYIEEAIQNHKDGKAIKPNISNKNNPLVIPSELQEALDNNKTLANQFEQFSRYNKRDFAEYIANAKRVETKEKRLQKIIPMILQNIGLNDKYRKK